MKLPHEMSESFIAGMRQFPAAVNVITTGIGADRVGFTASAVMSLTAEPPQLGVAVNRSASAFPHIRANGVFCVNSLATHHGDLARGFAGAVKGNERFLAGNWDTLVTGAPALDDALINFDCVIDREVELSSHVLLIGTVKAVRRQADLRPLLYVKGDWASLLPGADSGQSQFMGAVEKSIAAIDAATSASADPRVRLDHFVRNFTKVYIEQQTVTRDYLTAEIYVQPEVQTRLNDAKRMFDRKLVDLLEDGRAAGRFDLEDPRVTALAISGLVGWLHRWFRPEGRLPPDEVARLLADLVRRMVEAPSSAAIGQASGAEAQPQSIQLAHSRDATSTRPHSALNDEISA